MKNAFRVISILEGLSYIILLFIAVPIKYLGNDESYVKMLGMPHGLLFVAYIVLAYLIKDDLKWNSQTVWTVLAASIIPFVLVMSFALVLIMIFVMAGCYLVLVNFCDNQPLGIKKFKDFKRTDSLCPTIICNNTVTFFF